MQERNQAGVNGNVNRFQTSMKFKF
jgi:hypothetical protein